MPIIQVHGEPRSDFDVAVVEELKGEIHTRLQGLICRRHHLAPVVRIVQRDLDWSVEPAPMCCEELRETVEEHLGL